ncbi:MAG: isoprenylcysteine carboxylmethyltransferase family protein [Bacteroidota bacterium]
MDLKLLPPLTMALFGSAMYLLNRFLPFGTFDFFGRQTMAYVLMIMAIVITAIALFQFSKAKTTTDPINPDKTTSLVTEGIYRFTRNPMYLALLLVLVAFGLILGNAFNVLLAAGFVYYMNRFQIKKEEVALSNRFGKTYALYCKATRRWF